MKSNVDIAEEYIDMIYPHLKDGGMWVSSNLPDLPSADRKAVLKVYRKRFSKVEYDAESGACVCTK